jgi:hypothetical protein
MSELGLFAGISSLAAGFEGQRTAARVCSESVGRGTLGRIDSVKLMNLLLANSLKLLKFGA